MKNNFCTLFDSKFLLYGLAMYESLKKNCSNFHLYIFAFDNSSYNELNNLSLDFVTVISLTEFEDDELLKVKPTRSKGEYCWTSTSSTVLYVFEKYSVPSCTYIDSDIFFLSKPSILIDEMKEKSVLITEHWYSPEYDQTETSGKYCVQFITFKNNKEGLSVLKWWRERCLEWCFSKIEDGKFGDQKYLDDWLDRFGKDVIHVLKNRGGGVAPWNIQQYKLKKLNIISTKDKIKYPFIFYHFHDLKINKNLILKHGKYKIRLTDYFKIYRPYIKLIIFLNKNNNIKSSYLKILLKEKLFIRK